MKESTKKRNSIIRSLFRPRNVWAVIFSLIGLIVLWSYVTGDALAFNWFDWNVGDVTKFFFAIVFLAVCGMCLFWFVFVTVEALNESIVLEPRAYVPMFQRVVVGIIPFLLLLIATFFITSSVRVVKSQMWHGHGLIDKVMEVEAR